MTTPNCSVCGEPMPAGEEMFKFHGYSGPCPKEPPLMSNPPDAAPLSKAEMSQWRIALMHGCDPSIMSALIARLFATISERDKAIALAEFHRAAQTNRATTAETSLAVVVEACQKLRDARLNGGGTAGCGSIHDELEGISRVLKNIPAAAQDLLDRVRKAEEDLSKFSTAIPVDHDLYGPEMPVHLGIMNGNVCQKVIRGDLRIGDFWAIKRAASTEET